MAKRKAKAELWPTLGPDICDWIETYLVHGPGDVQGQPIEIDDEYRRFLYRCYELHPKGSPKAGRRRYSRAFLSRPKGRAKSELAGMVACAEALAPVRFDGWDRYGRPVGRPVLAPDVRCFATEEGQAGNTFDNSYFMLLNGEAYDEYGLDDVGLTRINIPGGGSIKAVTAAASSKDGGKDTFDVFDETHLWTTPQLRKLHDTVTRNLSKRMLADGWALETSTMYGLGEGSVAELTHTTSRVGADDGLLFDHRQADMNIDLTDDKAVLAGLRHVYGPAAAWMDLEGILRKEFRNPAKTEADNRRYWLNQPVKLAGRLFDPDQLTSLVNAERSVPDGARVVLGFVAAGGRDSGALVAWTAEDTPHLFALAGWPASTDDGPMTTRDADTAVREAFERYDVVRLAATVVGWRAEVETRTETFGDERVVAFDLNQPSKMGPATDRFYAAASERRVTWDGSPQLRRHLVAAERKDSNWGPLAVRPGDERIEAVHAAVIAYSELRWASHTPEEQRAPQVHNLNEIAARILARRAEEHRQGVEALRAQRQGVPEQAAPQTSAVGQNFVRFA